VSDPYRPGQYPPPGLDQTTRIPPVRAHPAPPGGPRPPAGRPAGGNGGAAGGGNSGGAGKTREYVLKGLGLVMVAVVSGMLWWLIQQSGHSPKSDGGGDTPSQQQTTHQYARHEATATPVADSNCDRNSYGEIQKFFQKKPCTQLLREVYTTAVNGKTAYISVAMTRMPNAADAAELKALTEKDQTGNVSDLVRDGRVKVQGLRNLSNGGFAASVNGTDVVIIETDYEGGSKNEDETQLDEIANDALKLGDTLRKQN
jgi:hypothetical protein